MFKRVIVFILLGVGLFIPVAYSQPSAAIGMQPGQVVTPWDAFSLTTPITSQSYSIQIGTKGVPAITWQVTTPSAPTSFTVNLQTSLDGTTYATTDSTTAVGVRSIFGSYKFIRFTVSAVSGGTLPTITVSTVYSLGNAVSTTSGAIYGGGTFTGPLFLPDGTVAAPSLSFAAEPTLGFYRPQATYIAFTSSGTNRVLFGPSGIKVGANGAFAFASNNDAVGAIQDTILVRDAANTLALRNAGTAGAPVPQTFNVYNFCDGTSCATGYERVTLQWSSNTAKIFTEAAGTGTNRILSLSGQGGYSVNFASTSIYPSNIAMSLGAGQSSSFAAAYLNTSIQGSKSKTLTESAATSLTKIAVPQTAGSNFADAVVHWVAYAADATDTQTRRGQSYLAAVNKAGVETCTVGVIGTTIAAVSAGTLTCAETCAVGLTDEVEFQLNCVSSLTQTTLKAQYRVDMMQSNTITPQ